VKSAIALEDAPSKKPLEILAKLSKSKEQAVAYEATALLAASYRNANDVKSAERLLEKMDSVSGFEKLPADVALPYFLCLLELAHIAGTNIGYEKCSSRLKY